MFRCTCMSGQVLLSIFWLQGCHSVKCLKRGHCPASIHVLIRELQLFQSLTYTVEIKRVKKEMCSKCNQTLMNTILLFQLLCEKGHLSQKTQQMINSNLTSIMKESLSPRTEFWDSSKTLKVLAEESYFRNKDSEDVEWPEVIKTMMSDCKFTF